MIKRTVEISNKAYVSIKHDQLNIEQDDKVAGQLPVEDLGVLILGHPAIIITQAAIAACQEQNCLIVFCDRKYQPVSALLPLRGNSLHSRILKEQIALGKVLKKRMWQQIVISKINAQAAVLQKQNLPNDKVARLSKHVKSGDPENVEAHASRIYWQTLFGADFRRDKEAGGVNILLNYGYSIIRSAVARAICGSGLHPALGIHHHNQYNAFCLADDLMEPLRPSVDMIVFGFLKDETSDEAVTQKHRVALLNLLSRPFKLKSKSMPLMVALHYYAASFRNSLTASKPELEIPQI